MCLKTFLFFFIDYEKAFDKVQHDKLINNPEGLSVDAKDIRCIKNLYWRRTVEIRGNDGQDKYYSYKQRITPCQRSISSFLSFHVYSEVIFQETI